MFRRCADNLLGFDLVTINSSESYFLLLTELAGSTSIYDMISLTIKDKYTTNQSYRQWVRVVTFGFSGSDPDAEKVRDEYRYRAVFFVCFIHP